jgi:hypothetical protein
MKRALVAIVSVASLSACAQGREVFDAPDIQRPAIHDFRNQTPVDDALPVDPTHPAVFISGNGEPCLKKSGDTIVCNTAERSIEVSDVISGTI